jgi:hypothetical protein
MPRTKRCSSCHTIKQLTAFGRQGLDSWCRTCRRDYQRRWMSLHRDEYNAKHRAYYQQHRDELREYNRVYQRRRRALMQAGKWKGRAASMRVSGRRPRSLSRRGERPPGRSGARSS